MTAAASVITRENPAFLVLSEVNKTMRQFAGGTIDQRFGARFLRLLILLLVASNTLRYIVVRLYFVAAVDRGREDGVVSWS